MSRLVENILHLHGAVALALVFALPALEASTLVGFVFPGEVAVLLGGVLAFEHRVSLVAAIAAAVLGAIVGDTVGYAVGRRYGETLLSHLPRRLVRPDHVARGRDAVKRLGGKAVFVGRFTAALRALVPGLCGIARMPYPTFALYNALGGLTWATGVVLLGYAAGRSWRTVQHRLSVGSLVLAGVVVVGVALSVWLRRRRARAEMPQRRAS